MSYLNNCNNCDDSVSVGTTLPISSKAYDLLEDQENKSKFMRDLLNDFVAANGIPAGYTSLSETERLRRYFRVPVPRSEVQQSVLSWITRAEEDKDLPTYMVGYVAYWLKFSAIYFPDPSSVCHILKFIIPSVRERRENGLPGNSLEYAFIADLKAFGEQYAGSAPDVDAKLGARGKEVKAGEEMFIQLAHLWFSLPDSRTCGYSDGKVAGIILEFMKSYIQGGFSNDLFMPSRFISFVGKKVSAKPASKPSPTPAPAS